MTCWNKAAKAVFANFVTDSNSASYREICQLRDASDERKTKYTRSRWVVGPTARPNDLGIITHTADHVIIENPTKCLLQHAHTEELSF